MSATVVQTTVEKLKEKLIQTALDLPEFRDLLKDSVNEISAYAKKSLQMKLRLHHASTERYTHF